jgi:hypothetical protein
MNEIMLNILLILSGATGQYVLSAFLIPKKDQRDADKQFIDTLIQRIGMLEGSVDLMSKQITTIMTENATLKVEMDYLRKENHLLQMELSKKDC